MTKVLNGLRQLLSVYQKLNDALLSERAALRADDADALLCSTALKQQLLAEIHRLTDSVGVQSIAERIDLLPERERDRNHVTHRQLLKVARKARDNNAINGKIIRRSQQSVHALLALLRGNAVQLTYGPHGETPSAAASIQMTEA